MARTIVAVSPHQSIVRVLRALRLLREPVPNEKQWLMRARWEALDPRWRTLGQGLGQQATGCGATIGVQPRCDFSCTACYLGANANQVPPESLDVIFRQLDDLRAWLGPKGNVQITDGEVTLRPVADLVAILRYARRLGLISMLMTHGDTFRRCPGVLERLMTEGGLTEVSIHVDTTQRGRLDFKHPTSEIGLEPLRDEFADMIRKARRSTGRPLRAATTMTITSENLADVPPVVDWCLRNRDVFGMLSFQPVAQVGRTQSPLCTVTVAELWARIDEALSRYGGARRKSRSVLFGHPDCTRIELFTVYQRSGSPPRLMPIVRDAHPIDLRMMREFFEQGLGGLNFRDDSALDRVCRAAGVVLQHPHWVLGPLRRWAIKRLRDLGTNEMRLAWDFVRRKARLDTFCVVSHHFMNAAELATDNGHDRLAACVFRVPIGREMVPMCLVNAAGARESVYAGRPMKGSADARVVDSQLSAGRFLKSAPVTSATGR